MQNFYLTFSQAYRFDLEHSYSPNIHPDGWIRILAPDYATARHFVHDEIGTEWVNLYTEQSFSKDFFPRGELICLEAK